MRAMLHGLGMQEGEAIEHRWVTRAIETSQRKVEAHNFDIRKQLLEYDNGPNDQRKAVYELRDQVMAAERVTDMVDAVRPDVVNAVIDAHVPPHSIEEQWNIDGLNDRKSVVQGKSLHVLVDHGSHRRLKIKKRKQ